MSGRVEQSGLLRNESPPDNAVVVIRGGPDTVDKIAYHAAKTAKLWSYEGAPVEGISVFLALGDSGEHSGGCGMTPDRPSHFKCYSRFMRVPIRDLRNDTRAVIEAVERGVDVVLTRRGHPIARIVPMEPDGDDLATWLDAATPLAVRIAELVKSIAMDL